VSRSTLVLSIEMIASFRRIKNTSADPITVEAKSNSCRPLLSQNWVVVGKEAVLCAEHGKSAKESKMITDAPIRIENHHQLTKCIKSCTRKVLGKC
jgi:hypothetical protein